MLEGFEDPQEIRTLKTGDYFGEKALLGWAASIYFLVFSGSHSPTKIEITVGSQSFVLER